ncbi:sensor histidine kinase [Kitasatospora camelliae]|uniref:histidine kinase n=1 Tax=Kitasatospora camelliae TaxID=3156397 RepID=A0AAU8JVX2_9ACTN
MNPLSTLARSLAEPSPDHRPLLSRSPRIWVRVIPYLVAVALIASLLPTGINLLRDSYHVDGYLAAAVVLGQTLPLLAAVGRPLQAWWVVGGSVAAGALLTADSPTGAGPWPWPVTSMIGYFFLMLALALREHGRTLLAVWLTTLLATAVAAVGWQQRFDPASIVAVTLSGAVLLLGWSLRGRGEAQRLLAEQERISEAERGLRTLLEERARIARELHDVVAHHMSVITVQADSAPYRIEGLPVAAVEEFGSIAAAARGSLSEMRRLLGVLRSADSEADKTPQPGLADLDGLVRRVAAAGVAAELAVDPAVAALGELPPAVDLSAYRIVQEALANVVRHAPGARARVALAPTEAGLAVTVVNDAGPGGGSADAAVEPGGGTGHGLVGMRERVRLLNGSLDTGPLPDGGFRVAAVLPVDHPGETTA